MNLKRLDWILVKAQSMNLTSFEQGLIDGLTERRERYGDRVKISDRVEEILEEIAAK